MTIKNYWILERRRIIILSANPALAQLVKDRMIVFSGYPSIFEKPWLDKNLAESCASAELVVIDEFLDEVSGKEFAVADFFAEVKKINSRIQGIIIARDIHSPMMERPEKFGFCASIRPDINDIRMFFEAFLLAFPESQA